MHIIAADIVFGLAALTRTTWGAWVPVMLWL